MTPLPRPWHRVCAAASFVLLASAAGASPHAEPAAPPAAMPVAKPASAPLAKRPSAPASGPAQGKPMMAEPPHAGASMPHHPKAWKAGPDNTAGWHMMSQQERAAHHKRLAEINTRPECESYMQEHHRQMVERAKERHKPELREPRHDLCKELP